jgi:glycosyltransferase involved in cell wall biosynthesis
MIKTPKVSVIIPAYNQANFIDKAIESVLRQTYQDFEIIIINDGSKDNTEEIVKNYSDFRIRYICHANNMGVSEARNTGIRASRCDCIALLDSDDEFLPVKLDMQTKLLRNEPSDVGVVCAWSLNMDKKGNYISKRCLPKKGGYIFEDLLSTNYMSVTTLLIRRECFEKVGLFDSSLDGQEDWDMWIRIAKYYKFSLIKIPLAKRRIHPNRISYNLEKKVITAKRIIKKHINELKIRRNIHSRHYLYIGFRLCRIGKTKEGRRYLLKAISLYPFCIKCYIYMIGSLFGPKFFLYSVNIVKFLRYKILKFLNKNRKFISNEY